MQKDMNRQDSFFSLLSEVDQSRLLKSSQEKNYGKGEVIFSKGEPGTHVWVVRKGRVHLQNVSFDGRVLTSCVMTTGDVFCCLPALDSKAYPSDAIAVEKSTVVKIPGALFREVLAANKNFSQSVLCSFCDRLRDAESKGCHAYDPAEIRIARVLLTLSKKFNNEIPLTRQEMSEIAGLTIETTIRTLSQMKKDGIIGSSRRMTRILNVQKLSSLIDE